MMLRFSRLTYQERHSSDCIAVLVIAQVYSAPERLLLRSPFNRRIFQSCVGKVAQVAPESELTHSEYVEVPIETGVFVFEEDD
jgi:hypothetical protein